MIEHGTVFNLPNNSPPNIQHCQMLSWHLKICLQQKPSIEFLLWLRPCGQRRLSVKLPSFGKKSILLGPPEGIAEYIEGNPQRPAWREWMPGLPQAWDLMLSESAGSGEGNCKFGTFKGTVLGAKKSNPWQLWSAHSICLREAVGCFTLALCKLQIQVGSVAGELPPILQKSHVFWFFLKMIDTVLPNFKWVLRTGQ